MKKLVMLFSTLMLIFGALFALSAVALASEANALQPASTITYNEDLTVNGAGRFNSVHIGQEGVGGVTYFNGTIINVGEHVPVTFGDDVRIDGGIFRTEIGPPDALKIYDSMNPGLTNANDLGTSNLRWKDLYLSGTLQGNNAIFNGALTSKNAAFTKDVSINGNLSLQPADSSPNTYIKMSATNSVDFGLLGGSNDFFKGLYHSSNTQDKEIVLGEFYIENFIEGTEFKFTGLAGYDRGNSDALMLGFGENVDTGEHSTILIAGDLEGNDDGDLHISSDHIYMESLYELRFKKHDALSTGGGGTCYAGSKLIKDGTLVRGDYGIGIKLYYCEYGWHELYP